jgi:cytochrome P450
MFREVADLYHDLDDGMRPISVIFPYLPTAFHRKRDAACAALHAIFKKVITSRRASAAKEDDILQVGGWVDGGAREQVLSMLHASKRRCEHFCSMQQMLQEHVASVAAWRAR